MAPGSMVSRNPRSGEGVSSAVETEARLCLEQWNRQASRSLQIRMADLEWNFRAQNLLSYRVDQVAGVPVIYAVVTEIGAGFGLSVGSLWLSLWGEIAAGDEVRFVAELEKLAVHEGKHRLVFGADEFHFLPGIPSDTVSGQRLMAAVKAAGYEGDVVADYVGPAHSPAVDAYIAQARGREGLGDFELRPVETHERLSELETFLAREFAGRWTREFRFWRSRSDCRRAFWMALTKGASSEILGFARMAVRSRVEPLDTAWTPGSLRLPLWQTGETDTQWNATDSCLGPIGVARSLRGQGAGRALLGRVLETLQSRNADRICIDWTDAFHYYEPLQFLKVRQYQTAWKSSVVL